jgi:hypothetical protein
MTNTETDINAAVATPMRIALFRLVKFCQDEFGRLPNRHEIDIVAEALRKHYLGGSDRTLN